MNSIKNMIRSCCVMAIAGALISYAQAAPPVANVGSDFTVADYNGNNSVTVQLNASASTDADGDIVSYEWTWDGGSASGQISEGVFSATNAPVTVTLTVTDALGDSSADTLVVAAYEKGKALFSDFTLKTDWWQTNATIAGETLVMSSPLGLDAVYRRTAGVWSEMPIPYFGGGNHVAVDSDTVFGGFFYDGFLLQAMRHDGNQWNLSPLTYPDPILPREGNSLNFAVSPDTVVVSDPILNGFAGRVKVYDWVGNNLNLATEILPSPGFTPGFLLGNKIAIEDDLMVTTSIATYGDQLHVFRKIAGSWQFEATLTADLLNVFWPTPLEANYFKAFDLSIANGKILIARYDPFQMVVIEKISGNWVQTPIVSNAFGTPPPGSLSYAYNFYDDRFSYKFNDDGKSFVVGDQTGRFFLFRKGEETANWAGSSVTNRRLLTRDLSSSIYTKVTGYSNNLIVISDWASRKARVIDSVSSIHPINAEPIANAGPDITSTSFDGGPVSVFLNGAGSRDLNYNSPLTAVWTWDGGSTNGLQPTVSLPPSVTSVVLTVTDIGGAIARDTIQVNIESPPVIYAGPDISVVDTDGSGTARVRVNGTLISSDNPVVSWNWRWPGGTLSSQSGIITLGASANGKPITLEVVDSNGLLSHDQFIFRISATNPQPVIVEAPGGSPEDFLGQHVTIQNGTALVSAPGSKVDGEIIGASYMSRKINNAWQQVSLSPETQQGSGVLIDGDTAFVGAAEFDIMDGEDVLAEKAGRVVIYQRQSGVWNQTGFLSAPIPASHPNPALPPEWLLIDAQFGYSMAKSGNWLLIGAVGQLAEVPGLGLVSSAGLAYLFENVNGIWTFRQKLSAPDAEQSGRFGNAVAIHGDSLAVSGGTGVYIFTKGPTQWNYSQKFQPDGISGFSGNVVMNDTEILVGLPGEFNGILPGNSRGVIYRYTKGATTWVSAGKIIPTMMRGISNGSFGSNLFLRDNILVVGAPLGAEGRVDVWRKGTTNWEFVDDIFVTPAMDPHLNVSARFGWSVSHDGKDLIVGAPSGFNSAGIVTGKAYLFENYAALDPTANYEPIANAGADIQVNDTLVRDPLTYLISEPLGSELVTLDATASDDQENAIGSYEWTWQGGGASGISSSARLPVGTTIVTLTVTDAGGVVSSDTLNVTVSLTQTTPTAVPDTTTNTLTLDLPSSNAKWRLSSEFLWHGDGEPAIGIVSGATYQIEIIAFPGSTDVITTFITASGSNTTEIIDLELALPRTGNGTLSFPETSQGYAWRLTGEAVWRNVTDDGDALAEDIVFTLPTGDHRIEYKPMAGFTTPQSRTITITTEEPLALDWAEYLRINNFDAAKTFEVAPSPDLAGDPYQYVGMIRSSLGRGSGTVVAERVVLSAAHLFFDANGLQWADSQWFSRQQQDTRQAPPLVPRGILYQTSYAKLIAPDSVPGTVANLPEDPQEVDFAVLYFNSETNWDQGSANFLQSTAEKNWLTGNESKHAAGYPQRSQQYENRGKTFQKQFASPLVSLGTGLYETSDVFGDGGASGSALFVQPLGGTRFYPAAILLAGQGRAVYRVIDQSITRMIKDGQDAATGNDEVLNGDFSQVTIGGLGSLSSIGVQVFPSGIRTKSRWTITPAKGTVSANLRHTDMVAFPSSWTSFTITFSAISGYKTPAPRKVFNDAVDPGENIYSFTYTELPPSAEPLTPLETWKQLHGITNFSSDTDKDGMVALMEYALNRNPGNSDYRRGIFSTPNPTQGIYAEYEVYVSADAHGITYRVKASNQPDRTGPATTLATFTSAVGTSGYRKVTDTQPISASTRRFAWLEVSTP